MTKIFLYYIYITELVKSQDLSKEVMEKLGIKNGKPMKYQNVQKSCCTKYFMKELELLVPKMIIIFGSDSWYLIAKQQDGLKIKISGVANSDSGWEIVRTNEQINNFKDKKFSEITNSLFEITIHGNQTSIISFVPFPSGANMKMINEWEPSHIIKFIEKLS